MSGRTLRRLATASSGGRVNIVPKVLTNLVTNGDFSNGTTGWTLDGARQPTISTEKEIVNANALKCIQATQSSVATQEISAPTGHVLHLFAWAYLSAYTAGVQGIIVSDPGTWNNVVAVKNIDSLKVGQWQQLTGRVTVANGGIRLCIGSLASDVRTIYFDGVLALDLTALFGAGKEPEAWQMDMWLKDYSPTTRWFDGTKTIPCNYSEKRLTNLVSNGDFSLGTQGWIAAAGYGSLEQILDTLRATHSTNQPFFGTISTWNIAVGKKIYVSMSAKGSKSGDLAVYLANSLAGQLGSSATRVALSTSYLKISLVIPTVNYTSNIIQFDGEGFTGSGDYLEMKNVLILDLTAIFGSGNEPTAAQMDAILAKIGSNAWFDGDTAIPISWCYDWIGYGQATLVNLVTNGDFSNGTTGWSISGSGGSGVENGALVKKEGGDGTTRNVTMTDGHIAYLSCMAKVTSSLHQATINMMQYNTFTGIASANATSEEFSVISCRGVAVNGGIMIDFAISNDSIDGLFDNILCIDLTASYGAGNEPSKEYMDALLLSMYPTTSWFNGTVYQSLGNRNRAGMGGSSITRREERISASSGGSAADNIVKDGLVLWLDGRDFKNTPTTPVWLDRCGNNHAVASSLAYTNLSGSDGQGGVKFDGVDDKFLLPLNMKSVGVGDFTLDFVYVPTELGVTDWDWLFSQGDDSNQGFIIARSGTLIRVCMGAWFTDVFPLTNVFPTPVEKRHIVFRRASGIADLFLDNALKYHENAPYDLNNCVLTSSKIGTVSAAFSKQTFNTLKYYNRALSDSEILQNYTASLSL